MFPSPWILPPALRRRNGRTSIRVARRLKAVQQTRLRWRLRCLLYRLQPALVWFGGHIENGWGAFSSLLGIVSFQ
jgi:hypothetical protein